MIKRLVTLILLLSMTILVGCSKPLQEPEKIDPIYSDLLNRSQVAHSAAEEARNELKTLKEDLGKLAPRDPSLKKLKNDIAKTETRILVADQEGLYFEIRAKQRKNFARKEYLNAYSKKEKWPDPEEFRLYKIQRSLESAPRDWSAHLKKESRYNKKSEAEMRDKLETKLKSGK